MHNIVSGGEQRGPVFMGRDIQRLARLVDEQCPAAEPVPLPRGMPGLDRQVVLPTPASPATADTSTGAAGLAAAGMPVDGLG